MNPIKAGKRDVAKMAALLNQDYETAEDAAEAALSLAFDIYRSKGKFTVVGQLFYQNGYVDPEDERASKVALGWYPTEIQARTAAGALVYNAQTHEEFRVWVLPVFHGTPNSYYTERKEARKAAGIGVRADSDVATIVNTEKQRLEGEQAA